MSRSDGGGIARALAELDKDHARVRSQIERILHRLEKDPISPLDLRFTEGGGFASRPLRFNGKILTGTIDLVQEKRFRSEGSWTPADFRAGASFVQPLGLLLSPIGIIVAVRVGHDQTDARLKMEIKTSGAGSAYIVDPVNNDYLRLVSSSLGGEVVSGVPRTGLLAFEMARAPTDRLQVHFSDVAVSLEGTGRSSFRFEYSREGLSEDIQQVGKATPMRQAEELLEQEVEKVRREFLREQSGCAPALLFFFASLAAVQRWMLL